MNHKSYLAWNGIKAWCVGHPNKLAAILTPQGMFQIKFIPKKEEKEFQFREFDEFDTVRYEEELEE